MTPTGDIAVYVHFPFCRTRCAYCDFHTNAARHIPHREYREAVTAELRHRYTENLNDRTLRSVYLGGGTPSLWNPGEIAALLDEIQEVVPHRTDPFEVTLEANPETLTADLLDRLAAAGVNRLSLGAQSFADRTLARLGRQHTAEVGRRAIHAAMASPIGSVTFDLIFAIPGQSLEDWRLELRAAAEFDRVDHVSVYELTFHDNTPLGRRLADRRVAALPDRVVTAMWEETEVWMNARNRRHYEVSNYAREGAESVHNSLYWHGGEYLGLGVAAHSMAIEPTRVIRRENCKSLSSYLEDPIDCERSEDVIGPRAHLGERLFLGLRTLKGIDLEQLEQQMELEIPADVIAHLDQACEHTLLVRQGRRYQPTARGLLLADTLAVDLC